MFCRNELVLQCSRNPYRVVEDLGQVWSEIYLIRGREHVGALRNFYVLKDDICKHGSVDFQFIQNRRHHALLLQYEGAQKMHWIDVILSTLYGQFMGSFERFTSLGCEFIQWRHGIILLYK